MIMPLLLLRSIQLVEHGLELAIFFLQELLCPAHALLMMTEEEHGGNQEEDNTCCKPGLQRIKGEEML